jgi:hypothetical protein
MLFCQAQPLRRYQSFQHHFVAHPTRNIAIDPNIICIFNVLYRFDYIVIDNPISAAFDNWVRCYKLCQSASLTLINQLNYMEFGWALAGIKFSTKIDRAIGK